jgi:hypothetical protein
MAYKKDQRDLRPLIIHLDSYNDLKRPSIKCTEERNIFEAPFDGLFLDLYKPSTTIPFILKAFIGIGSFIIPFLHALPSFQILHIYDPVNKVEKEEQFFHLMPRFEMSELLDDIAWSPSLNKVMMTSQMYCSANYTLTNRMSKLTNLDYEGQIPLDIDMDFFAIITIIPITIW